jgi:hypothetical protein
MKFCQLCIGSSALLVLCFFVGGCGTYAPEIAEVWDGPEGTKELEYNIKKSVFCELRTAVDSIKIVESVNGKPVEYLPDNLASQVTLSLEVAETSGLNPGVTFNTTMIPANVFFPNKITVPVSQQYNLGLGGTLSSQSTRIDKFNMYYSVGDLRKKIDYTHDLCFAEPPKGGSSFFLTGDLGIQKWLRDALEVDRSIPSSSGGGSSPKPDTISYEVKFIVVSSGNITPSRKLVRISANTANTPFFGANRTRTHDLIITLGPTKGAEGQQAANLHLASQIGSATAGNLRPLLSPFLSPFN